MNQQQQQQLLNFILERTKPENTKEAANLVNNAVSAQNSGAFNLEGLTSLLPALTNLLKPEGAKDLKNLLNTLGTLAGAATKTGGKTNAGSLDVGDLIEMAASLLGGDATKPAKKTARSDGLDLGDLLQLAGTLAGSTGTNNATKPAKKTARSDGLDLGDLLQLAGTLAGGGNTGSNSGSAGSTPVKIIKRTTTTASTTKKPPAKKTATKK